MTAHVAPDGTSHGPDERLRLLLAAAPAALAVLATSGLVARAAFSSASGLKYALTVAAPLALLLLVVAQRRTAILVVALTVVAPFAFGATFAGVSVTPLLLLLVPACVAAYLNSRITVRSARSSLRSTGWFALALGSVPLLRTQLPADTALLVVVVITVPMVVSHVVGRERSGRQIVAGALIGSASVQAILALYEVLTQHRLNLYGGQASQYYFFTYADGFRPAAAMPDPISLGNMLALALPLVLVAGLSASRRAARMACVASGLLIVSALAFTMSRMSWIGAVVGLTLAIVIMPPRRALVALATIVPLGALALTAVMSVGGPALRERFASILTPTGAKVSTQQGDLDRLRIWQAAREAFWQHPLQGLGFGNIDTWIIERVPGQSLGTHAHDAYLNIAAEAGLLGLFALALVMLAAGRDIARAGRHDRLFAAGLAGAVAAVATGWLTDYTVRLPEVLATLCVLFGLISGSAHRQQDSEAHTTQPDRWTSMGKAEDHVHG